MKIKPLFAGIFVWAVLASIGCGPKPPDLSDIPEPKPPPGYSPPPATGPAAPGAPQNAPQPPRRNEGKQ